MHVISAVTVPPPPLSQREGCTPSADPLQKLNCEPVYYEIKVLQQKAVTEAKHPTTGMPEKLRPKSGLLLQSRYKTIDYIYSKTYHIKVNALPRLVLLVFG